MNNYPPSNEVEAKLNKIIGQQRTMISILAKIERHLRDDDDYEYEREKPLVDKILDLPDRII